MLNSPTSYFRTVSCDACPRQQVVRLIEFLLTPSPIIGARLLVKHQINLLKRNILSLPNTDICKQINQATIYVFFQINMTNKVGKHVQNNDRYEEARESQPSNISCHTGSVAFQPSIQPSETPASHYRALGGRQISLATIADRRNRPFPCLGMSRNVDRMIGMTDKEMHGIASQVISHVTLGH